MRSASVRTLLYSTILLAPAILSKAQAADPQPYAPTITETDDSELNEAVRNVSQLEKLRESAPVSPGALIMRARGDLERAGSVLRALGYFDASVSVQIAGLNFDDPTLHDRLEAAPATPPVPVRVQITPGPVTTISTVSVTAADGAPLPADIAARAGLETGKPARGSDILAAEGRVIAALRDAGHAYARVGERTLTRDPATRTLSVELRFDPGPRVTLGHIGVTGLDRLDPAFAQRRLDARRGRPYSPAEVEATRRELLDLGVFSGVRGRLAEHPNPDNSADLTFEATERARRQVSFSGAYATSEGGSVGARWMHRNLFGNAERLQAEAEVNNIGNRGAADFGYRAGLSFAMPDFMELHQTLRLDLTGLRELTDAYDRDAILAGAYIDRPLIPYLTGSLGVSFEQSHITDRSVDLGINGDTHDYTLIGIPLILTWDNAGNPLDSVRGVRAKMQLTPYVVSSGTVPGLTTFSIQGSTYYDLSDSGRSVLALRGQFGMAMGGDPAEMPAHLRLYAGGSGTVRGFAYQSVGPQGRDDKPLGGSTMFAGSVEFRQRFWESWGAAVFVDAGGVGEGNAPDFPSTIAVGAGVGIRYYTGIGPIRADIAFPVSGRRDGDSGFQFYIGIGQAF